eukprot:SAG22_NODE_107_length_19899_cov_24.034141_5_plen_894_part_00
MDRTDGAELPIPVTCAMLKEWMLAANGNTSGWSLNCDDYSNGVALYNNWLKEDSSGAKGEDFANCDSWMMLPAVNTYDRNLMAVVMLIFLLWSFLGINIVADVFMSSIEVITAVEREVTRKGADGNEITVKTKFWNPTVANLSLMALGSSAPEIMLALLDTIQTLGQPPGALGPSTIVGSAAFNLFVISAVCVTALPIGEIKKIEQTSVFAVTATSSVFAYVWMVIVLSDEHVMLWEAIVTFLFFPLLLILAFYADVRGRKTGVTDENAVLLSITEGGLTANKDEVAAMVKNIAAKDGKTPDELAKKIVAASETKSISRNQYRINANKKFSGRRRALEKPAAAAEAAAELSEVKTDGEKGADGKSTPPAGTGSPRERDDHDMTLCDANQLCVVYFRSTRMAAFENEEKVMVSVERQGCLDSAATVDYATKDGSALDGEDYVAQQGTLAFGPGEAEKTITVVILNDDQWEPDEDFFITLSNPAIIAGSTTGAEESPPIKLRPEYEEAIITIIDDDEPGVLGFFEESARELRCNESCGSLKVTVMRKDGADGTVTVHYETIEQSAQGGVDFVPTKGTLVFPHQELAQTFEVEILDSGSLEKRADFQIVLTNPGGGALVYKKGGANFATVVISNDDELAQTVNKVAAMMEKREAAFSVETSSWMEQFTDAFACEGGVDENGDDVDPGFGDYLMHFLTIGFKVFFACIPPTDYKNGWMTFSVSLMFIGIVTFVVGEAATMFGCFVGIEDSITAITFVALGTSLPDTFASAHAAKDDSSADAAIGNVTGSNSVNVFLGLGLPWVVATIYSVISPDPVHGTGYYIPKGDGLSFSVAVFSGLACICVGTLCLRRCLVGGELGGGRASAIATAIFFCALWGIYVLLSILMTKNAISNPFPF